MNSFRKCQKIKMASKVEMTPEEREAKEQEEFSTGPLRVLTDSVKNNTQVLINCRNNKKLLGRVKAFDRHCNMVLEGVKEMWTELPKTGKGRKRRRVSSKLFIWFLDYKETLGESEGCLSVRDYLGSFG